MTRSITSLSFLLCLFFSSAVQAEPVQAPHAVVDLVAKSQTIGPEQKVSVGLKFQLEKNWHVYWQNPGDSGQAPRIDWQLPPGWKAGEIQWPIPQKIKVGPLMNYGYEDTVLLMTELQAPPGASAEDLSQLKAQARWLVCEEVCVPGKADLSLNKTLDPKLFEKTQKQLPIPLPAGTVVSAKLTDENQKDEPSSLRVNFEKLPVNLKAKNSTYFFPSDNALIEHAAPQKFVKTAQGFSLVVALSAQGFSRPEKIEGLLVHGSQGYMISTPNLSYIAAAPTPASSATDDIFFWEAFILAFLGGIILNLMPCVFPVLSIKVVQVIEQSQKNQSRMRMHSVLYTAGVLFSFWALAGGLIFLRAGGEKLGWGFQLQSPAFVSSLAALLFLLGLNLLGIFEIGTSFLGIGNHLTQRETHSAAFFTGVLATVVATPCTAPFMGTALGYAITQPPLVSMLIFTGLGLGLALPYVAISWSPFLGRLLPRPGRWMESFKQLMAFPLMATVIWLVWVLGLQAGNDAMGAVVDALTGLLGLALGSWMLGRWSNRKGLRIFALLVILGSFVWSVAVQARRPVSLKTAHAESSEWKVFSPQVVQDALSKNQPVFVDFTAAWCVTCQVNERFVLNKETIMTRFKEKNVLLLRADWTNSDPTITQALAEFNRNGVPLYLLYKNGNTAPPQILPQILTQENVLGALDSIP